MTSLHCRQQCAQTWHPEASRSLRTNTLGWVNITRTIYLRSFIIQTGSAFILMGIEPQGTAIPVPVARGLVQNILGSLTSGPAIYAMSLGDRTFVLHDGAAHLLGCCRQIIPQPQLACFSAQGQDEAPWCILPRVHRRSCCNTSSGPAAEGSKVTTRPPLRVPQFWSGSCLRKSAHMSFLTSSLEARGLGVKWRTSRFG